MGGTDSINETALPWYDQIFAVLDEKLDPIIPNGWNVKSILFFIGIGWIVRVSYCFHLQLAQDQITMANVMLSTCIFLSIEKTYLNLLHLCVFCHGLVLPRDLSLLFVAGALPVVAR